MLVYYNRVVEIFFSSKGSPIDKAHEYQVWVPNSK